MKKINYIFLLFLLPIFSFISCEDILDVNSDNIVSIDDNNMKSDSLYSLFGVLYELQKIADNYVILGELRGEMLEVSENANKYLKEIYRFDDYSPENPYTNKKGNYYSIINNCNYVLNNVDTTKMHKGEKKMYRVMAAASAIRAWTYMQLVLNYGEAYYFNKPLLSIQEALKEYTTLNPDELFLKLIEDILPYKDIGRLNPGEFGGFDNSSTLYFPVPFVLGDLYLWTGQYENAANTYRDLIYRDKYIVPDRYVSSRGISGSGSTMEFTGSSNPRWNSMLLGKRSPEYITTIAVSNEFEHMTSLDSLFYSEGGSIFERSALIPSAHAIEKFDSTLYFHDYMDNQGKTYLTTFGDLRKSGTYLLTWSSSFSPIDTETEDQYNVVKYARMNMVSQEEEDEKNKEKIKEANIVLPYRVALLYLRYAEAVNRLGKPNLAMAVLKNGLNRQTLLNRRIIPEWEIPDPLPNFMNFNDSRFDTNVGIHTRGAGNSAKDTTFFVIKLKDIENPTVKDSVLFVDNLIQEELALELAYEGNRFHDLMRFAIYRNDNGYLADIVAAKFKDTTTKERVRNKLNSRENWYINK